MGVIMVGVLCCDFQVAVGRVCANFEGPRNDTVRSGVRCHVCTTSHLLTLTATCCVYSKEFASREKTLERLAGIVTDLFVDWHKLHGRDSRSHIPALQNLIMSSSSDDIADAILKY
jgi:hypothetical protein